MTARSNRVRRDVASRRKLLQKRDQKFKLDADQQVRRGRGRERGLDGGPHGKDRDRSSKRIESQLRQTVKPARPSGSKVE